MRSIAKKIIPAPLRRGLRDLAAAVQMRRLHSVDELDAALAEVERAFAIGDAEGRRAFASFCLSPPRDLPADPDSAEYREAQLALYRRISGRARYHTENERSPSDLDVEASIQTPFPYQTRSPEVVGDQLISQGCLMKALPVRPPADLLEFGPGWGSTTLQFLQMGYRVTAVEVDPKFCEIIRGRCAGHSGQLELVGGDMLTFRSDSKFDAVVFFESFHHCADHVQMLRNVRSLLRPDGAALFAAEPVMKLPYPWGIRLDGESLWAMRRYGWLELGFDRRYFFRLLRREGFRARRIHNPTLGHISEVIVAKPWKPE